MPTAALQPALTSQGAQKRLHCAWLGRKPRTSGMAERDVNERVAVVAKLLPGSRGRRDLNPHCPRRPRDEVDGPIAVERAQSAHALGERRVHHEEGRHTNGNRAHLRELAARGRGLV
jgi:hypothetical protein